MHDLSIMEIIALLLYERSHGNRFPVSVSQILDAWWSEVLHAVAPGCIDLALDSALANEQITDDFLTALHLVLSRIESLEDGFPGQALNDALKDNNIRFSDRSKNVQLENVNKLISFLNTARTV